MSGIQFKRVTLLILIIAFIFLPLNSLATSVPENNWEGRADALRLLGLFRGTNNGYELNKTLTRAEAVTMVTRILGAEDEAEKKMPSHPFSDVMSWACPYVGYAYQNGITNGISDTEFGSGSAVSRQQFLTFMLRVLGYSDKNGDFVWNHPEKLSVQAGLITDEADQGNSFLRWKMVDICWNTLKATFKGTNGTVAQALIKSGIFTTEQYEGAKQIADGNAGNSGSTEGSFIPGASDASGFIVKFMDYNGTLISKQNIQSGSNPKIPENPEAKGKVFLGWAGFYKAVTCDQTIIAKYVAEDSANIFLLKTEMSEDGKTVNVTLSLQGTAKFCGFDLRLKYDKNLFELKSLNTENDLDLVSSKDESMGAVAFNYAGVKNITVSKTILTASFNVIGQAGQIGTFSLTPIEINMIDTPNSFDPIEAPYSLTSRDVQIK